MYLGIDFSGGAAPWQARCAKPTVWIASLEDEASPLLTDLRPVQDLSGTEDPFARLVSRLRCGDFVAAGIDAPFSIPAEYLPPGGHRALLAHVATLADAADRPFPSGAALVALAEEVEPLRSKKPMRDTEGVWAKRGVNTRSTLWNGPRGGAPFTAACLALLGRAGRPLWPWDNGPGMLVEAFPAAQLKTWGLPHNGYGKPEQRDARETILAGFAGRLLFNAAQRATMLETPDALDAVLAAFAGIAAVRHGVPDRISADGLIAVAEDRVGQEGLPAATPPRNLMDVASRSARHEIFEDVLQTTGRAHRAHRVARAYDVARAAIPAGMGRVGAVARGCGPCRVPRLDRARADRWRPPPDPCRHAASRHLHRRPDDLAGRAHRKARPAVGVSQGNAGARKDVEWPQVGTVSLWLMISAKQRSGAGKGTMLAT